MEDLIGKQLGQYQIVAPLGEGGMAAVYKAYQPSVERYVALKVLPRYFASDPNYVRRFQQEAKIIAGLEHPNILPVHDFGEQDGYTYIVMRYVEGITLTDLMKGMPLPLTRTCDIVSKVAVALDYAHSRGVVHRDVKPSNVMIDPQGHYLLSDFGLAKIYTASSSLTTQGAFIGTPTYASPEQCLGQEDLDGRSDVYSLGVMLYEMATGQPPFDAETPMAVVIKHIHNSLPPPRLLNPAIPESVERVILKALAKDRDSRYPTAGEMAQALIAAVMESGKGYSATVPPMEDKRPTDVRGSQSEGYPPAPIQPQPVLSDKKRRKPPIWMWVLGGATIIVILAVVLSAAILHFIKPAKESTPTRTEISSLSNLTDTLVPALPTATEPLPTNTPLPLPTSIPTPLPTNTPEPSVTITFTPLPTKTPTLGIGSTIISPLDGMVMVYVPEGEFLMGAAQGITALNNEKPQHTVYVDAFWIDQTEVTNAMFAKFIQGTHYKTDAENKGSSWVFVAWGWDIAQGVNWMHPYGKSSEIQGMDENPVVHVSWNDAKAYCAWAGGRLPTEAEWEKAARGTDGRAYPWGNAAPFGDMLNGPDSSLGIKWADNSFTDGYKFSAPVGSFPKGKSPYGALDMAGNVWEWVADWLGPDYYSYSPNKNPTGPNSGSSRVIRGGSWGDTAGILQVTYRYNGDQAVSSADIGFRCVSSP